MSSGSSIPESPTESYWSASPDFRALCRRKLDADAFAWAEPQLAAMGERAAKEVAPLAAVADRERPRLVTHDPRGERICRVEYHPAYREMERIAYGSGMIAMKYTTHDFSHASTVTGFALGYLFAMAEAGLYCPLCMTDGVARVLTRHGTHEQVMHVVPHLTSSDPATLWTGGMFLTERAGGSDVGANETIATKQSDGTWRLNGHKWFCSNVDAQAVLVTARVDGGGEGTRGLRTFLVLTRDNPGFSIERLKEKLGVRSMATGEVTLRDAPAEEVGGFGAMTDMLNLSRLYNAVAACGVIGRAVYESRHYIERRQVFGRPVIEWPLAQETFFDLEAEHIAALLLTFETIEALQRADAGDASCARLLRLLTPIAKGVTGKLAVPCVSEAMELVGGNGYIEESPLPRLLRDAQVLPIWEGTTNILVLDALRVMHKDGTHEMLFARIRKHFPRETDALAYTFAMLDEGDARGWIDRLARLFQLTLLVEAEHGEYADRLVSRPLGLVPGARVWT
ncbi:MAG: acyl-CoA dehydrogenase family protein [Acidobacteria bacterium]|nr:acyl-CoA dehydrogenase family protein [Acidobacteriota bacterium]MBV9474485.1 acyl-CoA dehydrogenase family protein [Acidobacteriota bacterium]